MTPLDVALNPLKWDEDGKTIVQSDEEVAYAKQQIKAVMLALIGEDYKPSQQENDKRYTRVIPPSSESYVSYAEAQAANYEFTQLRQRVNEL